MAPGVAYKSVSLVGQNSVWGQRWLETPSRGLPTLATPTSALVGHMEVYSSIEYTSSHMEVYSMEHGGVLFHRVHLMLPSSTPHHRETAPERKVREREMEGGSKKASEQERERERAREREREGGREGWGGEEERKRERERERERERGREGGSWERQPDISRHSCPSLAIISDDFRVGSASLIFSRS
jgi:hypothetical protein